MCANLSHLQINVSEAKVSLPFYKRPLTFLGYSVLDEGSEWLGMSDGHSA